jgi:signal transduction histidine kinase
MRSLYLRIWITVVAALALFALVSGWMVQRHVEHERAKERERAESAFSERLAAWGELLQRSLPAADEPPALQAEGLQAWSQRLRLPMALDGVDGRRVAASESFARREAEAPPGAFRALPIRLEDGRTLWVARRRAGPGGDARPLRDRRDEAPGEVAVRPPSGERGLRPPRADPAWWTPDLPGVPDGVVLLALLALLFAAVAAGAWPVVRRLTRRLEALQRGVEAFGAGALDHRVQVDGRDEVAALAASFNRAAARIETLVQSHRSLLANASHELRSPLARLKMALAMLDDAPPARRAALAGEIAANIAELDGLVEEVLLASRLDAAAGAVAAEPVDLLAVAAEEGARVGAAVGGDALVVAGDERLLRRAVRNLLENARRYGGAGANAGTGGGASAGASDASVGAGTGGGAPGAIEVTVDRDGERARLTVCDRGPGVPEAYRERIFEPFFRLPGHAEREGGVGLGLALVRQIAQRHGGQVVCTPRAGGGSCFSLSLPRSPVAPPPATGGATLRPAAT